MDAKGVLKRAAELQESKGHDYTTNMGENQHENFERVALILSWFNNPLDQAYVAHIATKIVRLAVLLNGKKPKNETIEDTFVDGTNYFALWGGRRMQK